MSVNSYSVQTRQLNDRPKSVERFHVRWLENCIPSLIYYAFPNYCIWKQLLQWAWNDRDLEGQVISTGTVHIYLFLFVVSSNYFGEALSQISRQLLSVYTANSATAEKCETWSYWVWVALQELALLHVVLWAWNKRTELSWMVIKQVESTNWNDDNISVFLHEKNI